MATSDSVSTISLPAQADAAPLKLWSYGRITGISRGLGFPGGIVLSIINARRMGMKKSERTYILLGILFTAAFALLDLLPLESYVYAGLNGEIAFGLGQWMDQTIKKFRAQNPNREVQNGGLLSGIGIALASLVIALPFFSVFDFILGSLLGVIK